jgi:hypothetical protein
MGPREGSQDTLPPPPFRKRSGSGTRPRAWPGWNNQAARTVEWSGCGLPSLQRPSRLSPSPLAVPASHAARPLNRSRRCIRCSPIRFRRRFASHDRSLIGPLLPRSLATSTPPAPTILGRSTSTAPFPAQPTEPEPAKWLSSRLGERRQAYGRSPPASSSPMLSPLPEAGNRATRATNRALTAHVEPAAVPQAFRGSARGWASGTRATHERGSVPLAGTPRPARERRRCRPGWARTTPSTSY